jgi:hypothetical protein
VAIWLIIYPSRVGYGRLLAHGDNYLSSRRLEKKWVEGTCDLYLLFRTQDDDDPFIKGEFDVIKELLEKIPEAKDGKQKVTYVLCYTVFPIHVI